MQVRVSVEQRMYSPDGEVPLPWRILLVRGPAFHARIRGSFPEMKNKLLLLLLHYILDTNPCSCLWVILWRFKYGLVGSSRCPVEVTLVYFPGGTEETQEPHLN
jgi:hypothetical protein